MKIAYYCDGMDKCCEHVGCYRQLLPGMDYCRHTFDPDHAIYGKCDNPEEHPERFYIIDLNDKETCYWEGDVFSMADLAFLNTFSNERELYFMKQYDLSLLKGSR